MKKELEPKWSAYREGVVDELMAALKPVWPAVRLLHASGDTETATRLIERTLAEAMPFACDEGELRAREVAGEPL